MLWQVVFQTVEEGLSQKIRHLIASAWRNSRTQDLENETIVGRGFCYIAASD